MEAFHRGKALLGILVCCAGAGFADPGRVSAPPKYTNQADEALMEAIAGQMAAMQGQISELKVANKMLMERQAALEAKLSDHTERPQVRCYSRHP